MPLDAAVMTAPSGPPIPPQPSAVGRPLPEQVQAAGVASEEAIAAQAAADAVTDALAAQCWKEFDAARQAKEKGAQDLMLKDLRQRQGIYEPDVEALIAAEGGSKINLKLTAQKCELAKSWLLEIFCSGEQPWAADTTPLPDIPAPIMQQVEQEQAARLGMVGPIYGPDAEALRERVEQVADELRNEFRDWAKRRAEFNEAKIEDELVEGGFYEALPDFFDNLCGLRAGFLKGPVIRRRKALKWGEDGITPIVSNEPKRTYYAPSPFDCYPSPGAVKISDGHFSERIRSSTSELYDLIGVEGFKEEAIREALADYEGGGLKGWWYGDTERAVLEQRPSAWTLTLDGDFDLIEHYTTVAGKTLAKWGVPEAELVNEQGAVDLERPYAVTCWLLGKGRCIGVRLNDDPLGERPYHKAGFRKVVGSFWYEGIPAVMADIAAMANGTARALSNNVAMTSGFITEAQVDRIPEGQPIRRPAPGEVLQATAPKNGSAGPAYYFHQPQSNAQIYMLVLRFFGSLADEVLGLPSFMGGMPSSTGAAGTSSGLSQLTGLATRLFGGVVHQCDAALTWTCERTHRDMVIWQGENLNGTAPHERITGDIQLRAKGSKHFLQREQQQVRLNELIMSTANPIDFGIMGPPGRAELLRAAFSNFDKIDPDRVLPNRDELLMKAKLAAMAAVGMQPGPDGNPVPIPQQPGAGAKPRATLPDGSVSGDGALM